MAKSHSMHAAKSNLSRLVKRAARGEDVVITRGTTPVARLVAIAAVTPARTFGAMKGRAKVTAAFFDPLPDAELSAWGE
jgi:prevent-host-death family protein